MSEQQEVVHTRIWEELAEPCNPFVARTCYCSGYDVYGDLLRNASWIEYLFLLFTRERPTSAQARLLERLAIAIANPGPRDPSVHAAMSAGVGGSTHASSLMAALAVGAGQLGGAHEVALAMQYWQQLGASLCAWKVHLQQLPQDERADVWPGLEHPPGFDPNGVSCATPVQQALAYLARCSPGAALPWLYDHRLQLEAAAGCPLAMTGVAAAALTDLGFDAEQGEVLYLLLRLPGAAVHALEQRGHSWHRFPFFSEGLELENDPGPRDEG